MPYRPRRQGVFYNKQGVRRDVCADRVATNAATRGAWWGMSGKFEVARNLDPPQKWRKKMGFRTICSWFSDAVCNIFFVPVLPVYATHPTATVQLAEKTCVLQRGYVTCRTFNALAAKDEPNSNSVIFPRFYPAFRDVLNGRSD